RDVVFVPVGLAYDRVLEDRVLIRAAAEGSRRFRVRPLTVVGGVLSVALKLLLGRFKGFGTAAAAFGQPVSLAAFKASHPAPSTEALAQHLMRAISAVVPVVPVPLVAAALLNGASDLACLVAEVQALGQALLAGGAVLKLAPLGVEATVAEGLAVLQGRNLVGADYRVTPGSQPLLDFYAASILQLLQAKTPFDHPAVATAKVVC
ncbi:MAG: glycerol-3-phosphate acyltransferase, partial [Candidatus Saccharibacteria bacterium]|nr:glycerol-3-phosphate acyltransferase [Pseudorhodobacter sp.]